MRVSLSFCSFFSARCSAAEMFGVGGFDRRRIRAVSCLMSSDCSAESGLIADSTCTMMSSTGMRLGAIA